MFVIHMLNSGGEWELCNRVFKTAEEAESFYNEELDMFDDYEIEQLEES